jgi:hypothetical protein
METLRRVRESVSPLASGTGGGLDAIPNYLFSANYLVKHVFEARDLTSPQCSSRYAPQQERFVRASLQMNEGGEHEN